MVVRIKTGKSIRGALSYNERKISSGVATLILASRFGCDIEQLGFSEKLKRLERLNERSLKVKTNTLHLSLNFSPYDDVDTEKMQAIALDYMNRIGFGEQPFLVYRHEDAHHPHIHIVTSLIQPDGRPINVHNIGKLVSEPARKDIEKQYNLIVAESMRKDIDMPLNPISLNETLYGQMETKRTISNIVREVVSQYHFSSLDELNAILKDYNIVANPGLRGSRRQQNDGLVYCMLDKQGNRVGIPITASSIYTNPTLASLQSKFKRELPRKSLYSANIKGKLHDFLIKHNSFTETRLRTFLEKRKISCHFIRNDTGALTDIQFVDHFKKVALNCNEIGIVSAAIQNRLLCDNKQCAANQQSLVAGPNLGNRPPELQVAPIALQLIRDLLQRDPHDGGISPEFFKKKRKKRKPRL